MANDTNELCALSRRIEDAFETGAAGQGRGLIEKALEAAKDSAAYREYFRAAAARYLANDRDDQGRRLFAAHRLAPDDSFLMRAVGTYLSATGNDEDAIGWFDNALEKQPDDYLAMRRKGVSLSRLGRMDEALMWFDNALETNPRDAASMRNLGVSLARSGKNAEAVPWFDKALELNPRDHAAMRQKGVSLASLGRPGEALEWYDRALEANPSDVRALGDKARTLIDAKDYLQAVAAYDRLIAMERNNPYHHLEKAIALGKLKRNAEAARAVEDAFSLHRPTEKVRRGKSYWLNRLGLAESARLLPGAEPPDLRDAGGEYGGIARVMEKTWEIFREDVQSFREKIKEAKNSFNVFINSSSIFAKDRVFLLGARKWNSFTPSLPLGENDEASVGGGYFLYANGVGTVIDPGFDFLENFNAMGGRLSDIHNIVVTHAHNDHTNDLESILTLFHQRQKIAAASASARLGRARPRRRLNLYLNMGAFQKFSPMINLRAVDLLGTVKVIAPHEVYDLDGSGIRMRVLPANHDEIFSTTYAAGLHFTLPTRPARTVVFTGDTGLFPSGAEITADNVAELEIGNHYGIKPGEIDYFIPHLGSIGDNELQSPDRQERLGESFYPNHLGVQGLIRLITMLRPKYVFVSEFGEELKGFIVLLMELITRCVREVNETNGVSDSRMPVILPLDLFFFCDLAREEIYCAGSGSFEPLPAVEYRHIQDGPGSQFYYASKGSAGAAENECLILKRLEHACRTHRGPFSDQGSRTRRMNLDRLPL